MRQLCVITMRCGKRRLTDALLVKGDRRDLGMCDDRSRDRTGGDGLDVCVASVDQGGAEVVVSVRFEDAEAAEFIFRGRGRGGGEEADSADGGVGGEETEKEVGR